jgi:hypothetical protein
LLPESERKRLYTLLTRDQWTGDPWLRKWMRQQWRRGHNHTSNQIIIRSDNVHTFTTLTDGADVWLAIPGLTPRTSVAVPPATTVAPTGTLRVILRGGRVEVHHQIEDTAVTSAHRPCGTATVGVDDATARCWSTPMASTTDPSWVSCCGGAATLSRNATRGGRHYGRSRTRPHSVASRQG